MKIMRRIFGVLLAILATALAVGCGTGVAILITHTYWSVGYSSTVTAVSGSASFLLFRLARTKLKN
jgi:hypothetical protein